MEWAFKKEEEKTPYTPSTQRKRSRFEM